ncbi:RNA methyltransferase [Candidatus Saccharibacteria bacterium]|jgi:TrmH family RNA methyltransferase|nr:RNA methyltransferase [Candidatus Saccharibacteria bacterium]MBP9552113.1 RNA methyltransferase [Candidatus Saccharibacteria bacterium]
MNDNAQVITSAQNPLIKNLVQLSSHQSVRNRQGLTLLEGVHLSKEYLSRVGAPEICLVANDRSNLEVIEIIRKCRELGVRIIEIDRRIYLKISPVIEGIGLMFVIKTPASKTMDPNCNTVILENIQDPGNLGTILRSAAAGGVEQIICSSDTASAWAPKVLRAGMGAHFNLNIIENQDLKLAISQLRIPIYATSLSAESSIYSEDLSANSAWIFGNEGKGVSDELQNYATKKLIIPQSNKIESLNVAMAATICIFEKLRQSSMNKT